jgi:two-component system copper resistance phosphate regulon response regulator CusR
MIKISPLCRLTGRSNYFYIPQYKRFTKFRPNTGKTFYLMKEEQKSLRRKTILCVEDNQDTCEMLAVVFSEYEFVSAETLQKARVLIDERAFDLFILDNWLPDGFGVDLCREIRASNASVPIIFVSGVGYEKDIKIATDAGANKYLVKPCEPETIENIVKELI